MARLPFPAYIIGENGALLFVNDAGRRASGWLDALADARMSDDGECVIDVPAEGRRYVDVRFPIQADGRNWTGGLAFDITDKTRAEHALRERTADLDALVRHLPMPVWIARGATGSEIRCNPAARAFATGANGWAPIRQCIAERKLVSGIACETVAHDGSMRTLRMTAVPLLGIGRNVRGALAFAVDSTPIAEYEAVISRVSAASG
jgi:hypothetical protein